MMVITRSLGNQGFPRKNRRVMAPRPMGLDLIFVSKMYICMYVHNVRTYVHPPPPTDSHLCVGPSFGNFQVPPLDPPLTPLDPQPPASSGSLLPTKEVLHTCKIVDYF